MKSIVVAFSLLAFAAFPAQAADDQHKSEAKASAGATKERTFTSLDTNKDGSVTRAEIAAHADLAAKFKDADKNHDGKLSRSEYDAMIKSGAAAGGSAGASASVKKEEKKPAK